jgi:hypothetical protein
MMTQTVPHTQELDSYLNDVIQAVKASVNAASAHLSDPDQKVVDEAIASCEEILDTVMEGHTEEWVA